MNGWNEFWSDVGKFFKEIGNQLYDFWFGTGTTEEPKLPYIASFAIALVVLVLGILLIKLILRLLRKALKMGKKSFVKDRTVKTFAINTTKVILYILLFFIFISILGIKLDGFSTILSSAILAVGLSLQDVVGNFASGIIILSSKPFVSGDYVVFVGQNVEGTIIDVNLLTTVLETVDEQKVIVPNKNITNNNIINYSANPIRRLVINLGINLDGDKEKVKEILLKLAKDDKRVLLDPEPKVVMTGVSENIFTVSLRCYVPTEIYWDVIYDVNEKLFDLLVKEKIVLGVKKLSILNDQNKEIELEKVEVKTNTRGRRNA